MKRKPAAPHLSREDRILWNSVVRTVKPLKGREATLLDDENGNVDGNEHESRSMAASAADLPQAIRPARLRPAGGPGKIDRTTRKKIAKGRLPLEARIDLHGLTQSEAYSFLLSFLGQASAAGIRHLLVITGKGQTSGGMLRNSVPSWFATAPFRSLVSGYEAASRQHGGAGALYVRLRNTGRDFPDGIPPL